MTIQEIITSDGFFLPRRVRIQDKSGREEWRSSKFFKLPLSYNEVCWVNDSDQIQTFSWNGTFRLFVPIISPLLSQDWFFCDEKGNTIDDDD